VWGGSWGAGTFLRTSNIHFLNVKQYLRASHTVGLPLTWYMFFLRP